MATRNHGYVVQLLDNAGASVTGDDVQWPGGKLSVVSQLTAGAVAIQFETPDGGFVAIQGLGAVAATQLNTAVEVPPGRIRAVTDGSGDAVSVWAMVVVS